LSGEIDHGLVSTAVLSKTEREKGYALFCCAQARSDLTIEGREAHPLSKIQVKTLPVRVEKMTRAAPDVMILELKLPGSEQLDYLPGQYIEILLNGGHRRAFSLATAPGSETSLQLHVRHVPGGQFTGHVFNTMKVRDMLRINGPHGSFFLREDSDKPILLVAGGTGFAPVKAIVEHAIARGDQRPMSIYWGGRHTVDLYQADLAAEWGENHSHIHYVPVLSDADAGDDWNGRCGLVHVAAMQDFPDLSGFQVYVCGSPVMVAAARRDFVGQCGLPEDEFIADSFEFSRDTVSVGDGSHH
jgi:CDP-4-dehydro-6-deoxyglucose reductase